MSKTYAERQQEWLQQNKLVAGNVVLVQGMTDDYEGGWRNVWNEEMKGNVGSALEVNSIPGGSDYSGIVLEDGYRYPYSVLKVVKRSSSSNKVRLNEDYRAKVTSSGIKVGTCLIPFANYKEMVAVRRKLVKNGSDKEVSVNLRTGYSEYVSRQRVRVGCQEIDAKVLRKLNRAVKQVENQV